MNFKSFVRSCVDDFIASMAIVIVVGVEFNTKIFVGSVLATKVFIDS